MFQNNKRDYKKAGKVNPLYTTFHKGAKERGNDFLSQRGSASKKKNNREKIRKVNKAKAKYENNMNHNFKRSLFAWLAG